MHRDKKTGPDPALADINKIRAIAATDMLKVDHLIEKSLYSKVKLINQLGHYIVNSGGKRLRPLLVLLSARAFGYDGYQHINLAAIIEFIHTATLLHDDVVDASLLRRGHKTANQRWGNEVSVLVGDFVYSRAFQMMLDTHSMRVMQILAETTNVIAEGEVQQLIYQHDPYITEEDYIAVIQNKTAKLFEAAAQLGTVISSCSCQQEQAMQQYGRHLGIAFQLIDDVLDYSSSPKELGKNIGDDLAEGKPTLPLLYAIKNSDTQDAHIILDAIKNGNLGKIEQIKTIVNKTGGIAYAIAVAKKEAKLATNALKGLPQSDYLDALYALAKFSIERQC